MSTPSSTKDEDKESSLAEVLMISSPALIEDTEWDLERTRQSGTPALTPRPMSGGTEAAGSGFRHSWASSLRGRGNSEEENTKENAHGMWKMLSSQMTQNADKMSCLHIKPSVLTHGLQHVRNYPCRDAVLHMTYGEGAGGFVSLHEHRKVRLYHPDGRLRDPLPSSVSVPYTGLTSTPLPGRLIGWGPGASLTLLDGDLRPLTEALDPLDVRVCRATEQSEELVTAGAGNVCVWALTHMVCRVRVVEGLGPHSVFFELVLAPPGPGRHHRALAVHSRAVVVVDLTAGRVLEHKRSLHFRDITALVYCSHLDLVVTASKDSIRVWDADWELCMSFVGHNGVVTSLACWPQSDLLLSASLDGTLRCWSLEAGDEVQCVPIEGREPPLALGGPCKGGTFFSFSRQGVDFWTFSSLYSLHCKLGGDAPRASIRQIVVPPSPPPYPARVLCFSGDGHVALVAAETGAVLTSFRAGQAVRCADYCLPKETLVALTEAGTVICVSTLTNPATRLEEWVGRGQGPWRGEEQTDVEGDQALAGPGPASYLVMYSSMADAQRALEEWRSLQEQRGRRPRREKPRHDAKNKFLVMLGHCGGCVSVLKLDSGKVRYRTPAHNGHTITAMQVDPENSYLLTAGEDKAVQVWRVFPYAQECLSLLLNLLCGQRPLHLALLGPLLALAFQEHRSATYSLVHFSLPDQSRTDHPPAEDHVDRFTGLCACLQLRVFASSSCDGTVRIWDEENRLLRTLQLSAEPECLAYSGERGDLLLGIRGDLYKINCTRLLPPDFQQRLLCIERSDPVPDLPIPRMDNKRKTEAASQEEHKRDEQDDAECERLLMIERDLASLVQGTCRKKRPPASPRTRNEAFDSYMRIIYGQPLRIKIDEEDMFDLNAALFPPKPPECRPLTPLTKREDFFPDPSLARPRAKEADAEPGFIPNALGFIPNSVVVGQLWPDVAPGGTRPKPPFKLRHELGHQEEASDTEEDQLPVCEAEPELDIGSPVRLVETPPREVTPSPPPLVVEKVAYTPKPLSPVPKLKPPTPPPKPPTPPKPLSPKTPTLRKPLPPKTLTPPTTRLPSPQIPAFLQLFLNKDWFKAMYPDRSCIRPSLCADEFSIQMLSHMQVCHAQHKLEILSALLILSRQGALKNTEKLSQGLMGSLRRSAAPDMSDEEHRVVGETLNVLVCLGPDSHDIIVMLLILLAHQELGLQGTVLCLLEVMGVNEANLWLGPAFESWDSVVRDEPNPWESLRKMASDWLKSWTFEYKVQNRDILFLKTGQTNLFVDVLNYFCSVEKERPKTAPPRRRKDTVLLHQSNSSQPIQRLGEMYTMSRIRRPRDIIHPPRCQRPVLMGSTPFLNLPLSKVSVCPFSERQPCPNASPLWYSRYFILERSYVDYYR